VSVEFVRGRARVPAARRRRGVVYFMVIVDGLNGQSEYCLAGSPILYTAIVSCIDMSFKLSNSTTKRPFSTSQASSYLFEAD
jgi:hypothetical protein